MGRISGSLRLRLPRSLALRGALILSITTLSVTGPLLAGSWLKNRDVRQQAGASAGAWLAVTLRDYLDDAAVRNFDPDYDVWINRLVDEDARLCWAGLFRPGANGLEFRRRTNLPLDEIVRQIPFETTTPVTRPVLVNGQSSPRFVLWTLPLPDQQGVLASIVDVGPVTPTPAAVFWLLGLFAVGGLTVAGAILWQGICRPAQEVGRWAVVLARGDKEDAQRPSLPEEYRELLRALHETYLEREKWRSEAGYYRYSLDAELDARSQRMQKELTRAEKDADTDALTRLLNRRGLQRKLPGLFERQKARRRELCAVVFDIDHFKHLNDCCGHAAGDELLAFVGQLLRSAVRSETDLAVRLGGDEFLLLLPDVSIDEAEQIAARVRGLFQQRARLLEQVRPRPQLSAGVAGVRQHGVATPTALLEMADQAMYAAKHAAGGVTLAKGQRVSQR